MTDIPAIAAVDLFCGIGGLTFGLRKAGVGVRAGFDLDDSCAFAYENNNTAKSAPKGVQMPDARFFPMDVARLSAAHIRPHFVDAEFTVLVGCAPCQPFSRMRNSKHRENSTDERWGLLAHFSRLVRETQPDVVSMENVPGLRHQPIYAEFIQTLEESGYRIDFAEVVNCADFGTPQTRRRLVVLATSRREKILPLRKTTAKNPRTVREAIADLHKNDPIHIHRELSDKNRQRILESSPGGNWRDWKNPKLIAPCQRNSKCGHDFTSPYGRMEWDRPAPTITTQFSFYSCGRFGHPQENRAITVREGALLQGFPPSYGFIRKNSIVRKEMANLTQHIGNAVPPELGRAIGESIVRHLQKAA